MRFLKLYESFDFQEDWIEENNTLEDVKDSNVYWSIKFIKPEKKIRLDPLDRQYIQHPSLLDKVDEWKKSIDFPYYESLFKKLVHDPSELIEKFIDFYNGHAYSLWDQDKFYLDWTHINDDDEQYDDLTFELDTTYYDKHDYKNLGDLEEWLK